MSWQNVRKRLRDLWYPGVSKSLDVHIARYRKSGAYDDLGRVTFVHNKQEIYVLSDSDDWQKCCEIFDMPRLYVNHDSSNSNEADKLGYYDVDRFYKLTNIYLNEFDVSKAFDENILLFQIYAILDRRIGKRTLAKNKEFITSNEILDQFYKIRVNSI